MKKLFLWIPFGVFLLVVLYIFFLGRPNDEKRMYLLAEDYLINALSNDSLSLHYTFANPEEYNIVDSGKGMVPYSKHRFLGDVKESMELNEKLNALDSESFDEEALVFYQKMTDMSESSLAGAKYLYYSEPLNPVTGTQSQLPILLAEYTFRSKDDVRDYLKLLASVPAYLDGIIVFEQEKAAAGLFMSDDACQKIIDQLPSIVNEETLSQHEHFLQLTFSERLSRLEQSNLISERERDTFIKINDKLLLEEFLPAYLRMGEELSALCGSGKKDAGLCTLPNGREYYSLLVKESTGSSKSIAELKDLLVRDFEANYSKLQQLIKEHSSCKLLPVTTTQTESGDFLKLLSMRTAADFPAAENKTLSKVSLKQVQNSLSPHVSPAFYLTPPYDHFEENTIYLNLGDNPDEISLFTTLAHEGYPGHLYETVYHRALSSQDKYGYLNSLFYYGGYTEGWATYVEMLSYDYLKEYNPGQNPSPDYEFTVEFSRLWSLLRLNLCCMLDLAIHDGGMTAEEAAGALARIGITDKKAAEEVYGYIVASPANYLTYYIGYLEILECRALASRLLQSDYSDMTFHTLFLNLGPNDFDSIKTGISAYADAHRPMPALANSKPVSR